MGDKIDVFIPLNQDTMDRHLHLLKAGACAIYDTDKITPGQAADGVQLCPMPMKELIKGNKLAINTAALGAALQLLGIESEPLEAVVARQFKKKGDAVVAENIAIARAGYDGGFSTVGTTYSSHFFIRIATFEMTCVALPFCV
jgi:2-oxoglutarate ferredoxin oxidoreductase subunit alpha